MVPSSPSPLIPTPITANVVDSPPAAARLLPWLLLLFAGSGCAALIYEIVWFQLLQFVIGSTAVSLSVLLGTFMGGMCLGSLLLPRLIPPSVHPLKAYAWLEIGLGILGVSVLFGLPFLDRLYALSARTSGSGLTGRAAIAILCLLVPTLLMGATLPAIARWVKSSPQGIAWLGIFYGGNTAGAVLGSLLAGFFLLRVYDASAATYVAAAINFGVGGIALFLAARTPRSLDSAEESLSPLSASDDPLASLNVSTVAPRPTSAPGLYSIYVTIGLSGLCALGAEVVWTRTLSLILGGTVYTFSIILAVFLLALVSAPAQDRSSPRRLRQPRLALGACQALLTLAIAWTAYAISSSLPSWPVDTSLATEPWLNFQFDLVRCGFALLPPALLWGASFPLALAAASKSRPGQETGRLVARIYAANTLGAILGAVGFSVIFLPAWGTQVAQQILLALSLVGALVMFLPYLFSRSLETNQRRWDPASALLTLSGAAVAVALAASVPPLPWGLVAYGRHLPRWNKEINEHRSRLLYLGEGMNSSVAVTELSSGVRNFHVSGKVEASSETQDMRLQLMLGHIPALLHPAPKSILIVGCGAGVTAGTFMLHPDVKRVVICEIEPLIPQVVARYFGPQNNHVIEDKRVEIHYDDARHFILTTTEKFDIITSDPIHPWMKGAATLYSQEYFELCKQRLNPGGFITQWVPLYESTMGAVKSEIATFFAAFPRGVIWGNADHGGGYDVVLMGQVEPLKVDVDRLQDRLDQPAYWTVGQALSPHGFGTAVTLLGTYAGRASDLTSWTHDAAINRDRNLRLQYLAGLGLNAAEGGTIYRQILEHRRYPADIFIASDDRKQLLMRELKAATEPPPEPTEQIPEDLLH